MDLLFHEASGVRILSELGNARLDPPGESPGSVGVGPHPPLFSQQGEARKTPDYGFRARLGLVRVDRAGVDSSNTSGFSPTIAAAKNAGT